MPPQVIESECTVLGVLMQHPDALARIDLDASDFYRRDHQIIYAAILDCERHAKPYDAVLLGNWFEEHGKLELIGGSAYLVELASDWGWTAASIQHHAAAVRDKAVMRKAIEAGAALVNAAFEPDGQESSEILDHAIRDLMALTKSRQNCEFTLKQAVGLAWADAQEAVEHAGKIRGVPSGYERIDARLGGFHKGDLVFIGARPSMGKTALMVNLALNAAAANHAVGIVSGEQSAMQVGQRSIAAQAGVAAERMRNGQFEEEDWPAMTSAMRTLIERRVHLYDRSAPTLDELCRVARRWKQEHDMSILFVDYLQRIRVPRSESRIEEVSEVARGLKTLARDLEIPVVALAQVKAEVDKRHGDKRPNLGDIANSDEATREADQIGFLYRDEVYHDESAHRGVAELNFEKNRHGPTGRFRLRFEGATMRFSDFVGGLI